MDFNLKGVRETAKTLVCHFTGISKGVGRTNNQADTGIKGGEISKVVDAGANNQVDANVVVCAKTKADSCDERGIHSDSTPPSKEKAKSHQDFVGEEMKSTAKGSHTISPKTPCLKRERPNRKPKVVITKLKNEIPGTCHHQINPRSCSPARKYRKTTNQSDFATPKSTNNNNNGHRRTPKVADKASLDKSISIKRRRED
ncbi:hypothetical protein SOVF_154200 [Spinacia oleracea]|nr:hypothetical protein SOVF_154200 [Spinacia oleracea]